jgi:hypothetical protein
MLVERALAGDAVAQQNLKDLRVTVRPTRRQAIRNTYLRALADGIRGWYTDIRDTAVAHTIDDALRGLSKSNSAYLSRLEARLEDADRRSLAEHIQQIEPWLGGKAVRWRQMYPIIKR